MQQTNPSLRPVQTATEIELVAQLANQIWTQHYVPIIGEKQVVYMLEKFQSSVPISEQINKGYKYFILSTSKAIGYYSILQEGPSLFLSKIYILSEFRGQGYGKLMMNHIIEKAQKWSCNQIRLTVNKNNFQSIAAYHKMGFKTNKEVVFDIGNGYVMDDYELILKL